MNIKKEIKPSLESIFEEFDHPNPNINKQAFSDMHRYWLEESMHILIKNLDSDNIRLRRKSVKAIAYFGKDIVSNIVDLFIENENHLLRLSCIKVLIIVASRYDLKHFEKKIYTIVSIAIKYETVEMVLSVVSLLRQLGEVSIPYLKELCRSSNLLRAKASLTALNEFRDPSIYKFIKNIYDDLSVDKLIRDCAYDVLALNDDHHK